MLDGCGRTIDHLRLSLTDHCNLACRYCVPEGVAPKPRMVDPEFAYRVVEWLVRDQGIRFVRLTGGEPLVYPELIPLIKRLARLDDINQITLTTNAQALEPKAKSLREAGLSRINISLDTLDAEKFRRVTRGGRLDHTLRGIEAAVAADLTPVKINAVVQRGSNEDEAVEIAEWGLSRGCVVRFLEVMPIGPLAHVAEQHLVPESELLERLREKFELRPIPQSMGQPSNDYAARSATASGTIGVIASTSRPFCERCRRLRITAEGDIVPCVHDSNKVSLRTAWQNNRLNTDLADRLLSQVVAAKQPYGPRNQAFTMLSLGG